jgi:asparagine synthase (glutamine-hydrolysing)
LKTIAKFHWKEKFFNRLADYLKSISLNQARNYGEQIKIFNGAEKESIYTPEFMGAVNQVDSFDYLMNKIGETQTEDFIKQLLYLDIHTYLPEDLLVKMDIATMANSLEARVPFLDHQFMEFIATIPTRLKLKRNIGKYILKKTFSEFLPPPILTRPKMGFGVPLSKWFRNELRDYIQEVLLDRRTLNRGYFRKEGLENLINDHIMLRYDQSSKIWALLFLEIWFRVFLDKNGDLFSYGS